MNINDNNYYVPVTKYINDDNYIVINCDRLYEMPTDKVVEDKYLTEIKDFLKNIIFLKAKKYIIKKWRS